MSKIRKTGQKLCEKLPSSILSSQDAFLNSTQPGTALFTLTEDWWVFLKREKRGVPLEGVLTSMSEGLGTFLRGDK